MKKKKQNKKQVRAPLIVLRNSYFNIVPPVKTWSLIFFWKYTVACYRDANHQSTGWTHLGNISPSKHNIHPVPDIGLTAMDQINSRKICISICENVWDHIFSIIDFTMWPWKLLSFFSKGTGDIMLNLYFFFKREKEISLQSAKWIRKNKKLLIHNTTTFGFICSL